MLNKLIQNAKIFARREKTRRSVKEILASERQIFLDLGASSHAYPGFIGLDINPSADVCCDLTEGIPFPDSSVEKIRSDHFFEHLSYLDLMFVLKECKRVLKKHGSIDVTVPCFDVYLDAYLNKSNDMLAHEIYDIPEDHKEIFSTPFDKIMWVLVRNGEHKSVFDKESFCAKLYHVGFSQVELRDFDPLIDSDKRFSSLYVRGRL